MDIIGKIEELRVSRGWSVNKLASEALLTQSTLSSMYKRNTPPKLEVLISICDAFGISLSQFFQENSNTENVTEKEKQLLIGFRKLKKNKKEALITLLDDKD